MVEIKIQYQGDLHCELTHMPSGSKLQTDAPKDNMGKGEAFSPTDLCAASLISCILTTMAIYANRHQIELKGATGRVFKDMQAAPDRKIKSLAVEILMPAGIPQEQRATLEKVAHTCPVAKSLGSEIQMPVTIQYPD